MNKHTPTPWRIGRDSGTEIISNGNDLICDCFYNDTDERIIQSETNAKHIVKCVNLHDELIDVLKEVLATCVPASKDNGGSKAIFKATKVIIKAEA